MERVVTEQFGHDSRHAFKGVGQRARLFENFFLHVVAIGAQFGCTAVRQHSFDRALCGAQALTGIFDPVFAQLQVDHIAFFQVDDLVGHAGQGHGVAGQIMRAIGADAHDKW